MMARLSYNPATDRYEGNRIAVPRGLFDACVAELVEGGMAAPRARAFLLDEHEWSDDIVGVELLDLRLCLHCRGLLEPPQQRFCDAVCEAAFYIEAFR